MTERLDAFLHTLDEHLAYVRANARTRETFAPVLANYGGPPGSGVVAENELRGVFRAIATRAWSGLDALAGEVAPVRLEAVRGRLRALEEMETQIVLERLAKSAPAASKNNLGVGAIFANATAGKAFWEQMEWKDREIGTRCATCGAAQEKPRDFRCRYCKNALHEAGQ